MAIQAARVGYRNLAAQNVQASASEGLWRRRLWSVAQPGLRRSSCRSRP